MIRHAYSGKMQVLGLTLIALLTLGVFLGSRAEALLDVIQIIAGESSSSTDSNLSAVHPADRKFLSGNYGAASAERVSEAASGADRKLLDPGYMRLVREQTYVDGAVDIDSLHPADRKLLNLGYLATVMGQSSDGENRGTVHPADRKFLTGPLSGGARSAVPDPPSYFHPADRKFLDPAYQGGQASNEDR